MLGGGESEIELEGKMVFLKSGLIPTSLLPLLHSAGAISLSQSGDYIIWSTRCPKQML